MIGSLSRPVFVALDVDTPEDAFRLANLLEGKVGGFKVGPRLVLPYGRKFVQELARLGPVFVDCKFYDIPSTMEHAVRAVHAMGASFATVHAGSGPTAMARMAEVERELSAERPFQVIAVTVLTSFSDDEWSRVGSRHSISESVVEMCRYVAEAGLSAVVCSPHEIALVKSQSPGLALVVPGIRGPGDPTQDQQRILSPAEALRAGADALVVGRPIVAADDPGLAAERLLLSLASGGT